MLASSTTTTTIHQDIQSPGKDLKTGRKPARQPLNRRQGKFVAGTVELAGVTDHGLGPGLASLLVQEVLH